jgi:hypothetical protein
MRSHYWTCSKFADWLRGTPKGEAKTGKGWYEWEKAAKETHPVRYWIAEEGLDYAQKIVYWPTDKLYAIKYYINNRFVTRTHALTAHPRDIKPGEWRDVGNRFLPCLFNELVDFIEIEKAWSHIAWGSKEDRAKYAPPFWASGWFRWRTWRCPQAGLDHLAWEMTLTNDEYLEDGDANKGQLTPQAVNAKEQYELYMWWTTVYQTRPDPHDASGWTAWCRREEDEEGHHPIWTLGSENKTPAELEESRKILDRCHEIEAAYEKEDEGMLIRLIKIRNSLWT